MKRTIKKFLLKVGSRRRLQHLRTLVRGTTLYDQAASLCEPGGGEIVVLAPHMDDEVLGCGGTIARHGQAGGNGTGVFLTDGRQGRVGLTGRWRRGATFDRQ